MARRIKISSSVLNVRVHPHNPERYAELLDDIYSLRKAAKLRGDRFGMISLLNRREVKDGIIFGILTTFLNIDFDGLWFDTSNLSEANEEDIRKVSIPENLHPNAATFYFYFDTINHKFYFQTYSDGHVLTPKSAFSLFQGLVDDLKIREKYGDVKVTLVQSKDGLAKMFKIPLIKEVKITINKPNADIFADDFEEQIEAHLAQAHSKKVVISYEAEPGDSVVPTPEIRAVSAVALENGSVEVKGRDASGAVNLSTKDQPHVLQDKYDPEAISEEDAFRRLIPRRAGQD